MNTQEARERLADLSNESYRLAMKRSISGGDLLDWEARLLVANYEEARIIKAVLEGRHLLLSRQNCKRHP